jgi:hypothetical protein
MFLEALPHWLYFSIAPIASLFVAFFTIPRLNIMLHGSGTASEKCKIFEIPETLEAQLPVKEIHDTLLQGNQYFLRPERYEGKVTPEDLAIYVADNPSGMKALLDQPQFIEINIKYYSHLSIHNIGIIKAKHYERFLDAIVLSYGIILCFTFITIFSYILSLSLPLALFIYLRLSWEARHVSDDIETYAREERWRSQRIALDTETRRWSESDPSAKNCIENFNQYTMLRTKLRELYLDSAEGIAKRLEFSLVEIEYSAKMRDEENWTRKWQPAIDKIHDANNFLAHKITFERSGERLLTRQPTAGSSFKIVYDDPSDVIIRWAKIIDDIKNENTICALRIELRQQHETATWAARTGNLNAEASCKGRIAEIESKLRQLGA